MAKKNKRRKAVQASDKKFRIEVRSGEFDPNLIVRILKLQEIIGHDPLRYTTDEISALLQDSATLHVIASDDTHRDFGYVLVRPHNTMAAQLSAEDPALAPDDEMHYIDQFVVHPSHQRFSVVRWFLRGVVNELKDRGAKKLSSHILIGGGLDVVISRLFRRQLIAKRQGLAYRCWGELKFDYLESTCAL